MHEATLLVASVGAVADAKTTNEEAVRAVSGIPALPERIHAGHTDWWHGFYAERGALLSVPETWLEGELLDNNLM
eukprot:2313545-Pyramimonas_sp.AAC.1